MNIEWIKIPDERDWYALYINSECVIKCWIFGDVALPQPRHHFDTDESMRLFHEHFAAWRAKYEN